jgi:hypothetical protein
MSINVQGKKATEGMGQVDPEYIKSFQVRITANSSGTIIKGMNGELGHILFYHLKHHLGFEH